MNTANKKKLGKLKRYFFIKLFYVFSVLSVAFVMYFFFSHTEFKDYVWLEKISQANDNFRVMWADKVPDSLKTWFSPKVKETTEEKLSQYKLTILSKNIDLYFKNLLIETQEQIANENLLNFIKNSNNYYNYYKIKRDLQKYLEHNADVLEFSLYNKLGSKLISLKYKNISDYLIGENIVKHVEKKNNVLLKHKNSKNLVLVSAVKNNGSVVMFATQTINPVFFTRILDRLEISDQLFYLKDSDDFVVLDNFEYIEYQKTIEDVNEKNKLAEGFYKSLVQLKEKSITIDFDNIQYSLGTVVERNNIWGNVISLLSFLIILYIAQLIMRWLFSACKSIKNKIQAIGMKRHKHKAWSLASAAKTENAAASSKKTYKPYKPYKPYTQENDFDRPAASFSSGAAPKYQPLYKKDSGKAAGNALDKSVSFFDE